MDDDFWAPRRSLRAPIPELEAAADLLALAADSLLAGHKEEARSYLEQANMPALRTYTRSIQSVVTREVHRLRHVPGLPTNIPLADRHARQPRSAEALQIYQRDGFRCRYCGCRIVHPLVEGVMSKLVPGAVRWGSKDTELNAAFYTLKGVLDHVDPHSLGGKSEAGNVLVACQPCNYGKGNWFIQQLGLDDPRLRPPVVDGWDGLRRLLPLPPAKPTNIPEAGQEPKVVKRARSAERRLITPAPKPSLDEFASSFSVSDRQHLHDLIQTLESCGDLGVTWRLGLVLLARVRVGEISLNVLGIEPDTTVQIPWAIGPHKRAFRPFAEILASGMTGGTVYETEKMWRVRCHGRLPQLPDLMQDPAVLRDAFSVLHRTLSNPLYRP